MTLTQDEIIQVAREAGCEIIRDGQTDEFLWLEADIKSLPKLAALIYAAGHRDGQEYSLDRVCDKLVEMKRKYDRMEQFAEKDAVALCIVEVEEMEVRELP